MPAVADHLNTALDDYFSIGTELLEPELNDEEVEAPTTTPQRASEEQHANEPEHIPFGNVEGSVVRDARYGVWQYMWSENGKRRSKRIGRFPDRESAWRAAEPFREAAKQRRRELYNKAREAEVEAGIAAAKKDKRELARLGAGLLWKYCERRRLLEESHGLRGVQFGDSSAPIGSNRIFEKCSMVDWLIDVFIAVRSLDLTAMQRGLFFLIYHDAKFTPDHAWKRFKHEMYELHAAVGAESDRRRLLESHGYFRPFRAAKVS